MSKSDTSDYSRLNMTDDAAAIALKIRKAKTDPLPLPASEKEAEARPEAANLLGIYAALSGVTLAEAVQRFAGWNFSDFKAELADLAADVCGRVAVEMKRLMADPGYIDSILKRGAERANAFATPVLRDVFDIMGLLRP